MIMMNDLMIRCVSYSFLLLFHSYPLSSYSPTVLYPALKTLVDHLSSNSTLPACKLTNCKQTQTQADYSTMEMSDEYLWKLTYRQNTSFHGPYLIASTGIYRGKRLKYSHRYLDQFLGIYYGEIPRTLEKPVKKQFNYSLQNATKFSPCCMQSIVMAENLSYGSFVMQPRFDENCLALNIYRPDLRFGEKRKAIMLFSHGGSNQLGGGSLFDGSILASEGDVIVITMNFRLNYHGFLSSGDDRLRGNYGLWDQLLAVEWIYENAHLFGGDPKRIVLAGHSAGAGNVMLIPASPYSRGMIRRIISQSGTGLAPWSINHHPSKLLQRFSENFHCQHSNDNEMLDCITKLLENRTGDIYRLHLSLNIADDNPYPVIDHDFINDTMENILQSDRYRNIDFLTGVTLNEGLYFAEYHIKHLYNELQNQSISTSQSSSTRDKRSVIHLNTSAIIPPDITFDGDCADQENLENENDEKCKEDSTSTYDPSVFLEQFLELDYVERYIQANFQQGKCFLHRIRQQYEFPANENVIDRLQLYVDLVSDLMFNFHMVRCLNLRTRMAGKKSTNYAYIYSHRPTFKMRSTFRDQLKILPQAIGHFAELDYVFGVPLARNYSRIHRNVNMSYYNYSSDEENFSREIIRYWSNFIKTGDPNKNPSSVDRTPVEWKSYTQHEHNYIYLQLNHIRSERNYFDRMYQFWLGIFQIEDTGVCTRMKTIRKHLTLWMIISLFLVLLLFIYFLWIYFQKQKRGHFFSTNRSPTTFFPYPRLISA